MGFSLDRNNPHNVDYDDFTIQELFVILIRNTNKIMANQNDLENEIQALATAISTAAAAVSAKLASLQAQIAAGASGADLSPQIAEIAVDITAIGNIGA